MPLIEDFEAARIRLILRELERTTRGRGKGPMLRLERVPGTGAGVVVRGVATRMGMVRLGLRIAHDALAAETMTVIDQAALPPETWMAHADVGVIDIVVVDE